MLDHVAVAISAREIPTLFKMARPISALFLKPQALDGWVGGKSEI
jgi:hypothetical protein